MVIFHSYVILPEGNAIYPYCIFTGMLSCHDRSPWPPATSSTPRPELSTWFWGYQVTQFPDRQRHLRKRKNMKFHEFRRIFWAKRWEQLCSNEYHYHLQIFFTQMHTKCNVVTLECLENPWSPCLLTIDLEQPGCKALRSVRLACLVMRSWCNKFGNVPSLTTHLYKNDAWQI